MKEVSTRPIPDMYFINCVDGPSLPSNLLLALQEKNGLELSEDTSTFPYQTESDNTEPWRYSRFPKGIVAFSRTAQRSCLGSKNTPEDFLLLYPDLPTELWADWLRANETDDFSRPLFNLGNIFQNWAQDVIGELNFLYKECSNENWDGYGAMAISTEVRDRAEKLVSLIPKSLPAPELVPEPNGKLGFEWYRGKNQVYTISVGSENIITYAGLFGTDNETHGTESFYDTLPLTVLNGLNRLYSILYG